MGVNTNAVFTRAVSMSEYEDVGNYTVQVIDDAGSTVKEFLYKDAPSEIKLKNGTYTLRAYYGEQTTASCSTSKAQNRLWLTPTSSR